ncbi:MAG: RNA polymerase sigma factor [Deltaproteobacteria bacterium]|nr:RNA polymerase sigma factor [Deltaproteobacteria bacterium]
MSEWVQTLMGLATGELAATDRVITLITKYLAYIGAYQHRDAWDDLVQEVLISLLKSPPKAEQAGAIVRHIQTTTYRKFIDEIRREQGRRRQNPDGENSGGQGWRRSVSLDDAMELSEPEDFCARQIDPGLRKALEALEARKRGVLETRYLLGCTNEEGARRLAIPLGTYKRLLAQGLAELRELLRSAEVAP